MRLVFLLALLALCVAGVHARASEQDCYRAIASEKAAAAVFRQPVMLSMSTCELCRSAGVGCPVGMNEHTRALVFSSVSAALTCRSGGIKRFDLAFGINTTYCGEDLAPSAIAGFVLAPILVMMLMCALACCLPLIRRRCSALFPPPAKEVVLPIPAVLLSAASVPADLPAPPPLQQMDMQPGCCAAPFDQKLDKLPSYDISKYSAAERELIAHSIEKGMAFFTQPPYNPADESERSCTRGLAARAVRTSGCSFGLGAVAWLLVVQLDVAYAVVHWVVSLYTCKEDLPGWGGVGAFVGDFWFSDYFG